jgi:mRNA-degrading endonuclease toxin of MazEF toxin-antitoxin module
MMRPWQVWTWRFPDAGEHPAVILGTEERVKHKARICVLLCFTKRATRKPEIHEVILDREDGLDWDTLCKCDVVYAVPKSELTKVRGLVTPERRRAIAERVIRSLGLAGL